VPTIRARRSLPAAILAIVLLVAACGSSSSPGSVGTAAPAVAGADLNGAQINLAAFKGHPVVLNFWASWCVPCRDEFPVIKAGLDTHRADGLAAVGVLFKDQADLAKNFVTDFGAQWSTVTDPDGSIAAAYRITAPPQTFFIDKDGIVRAVQIGAMTSDTFEQLWAKIKP
jgi:cytochrome c biogenesis protein CcmG, thiol:disulfide interchange protein DsbE